MVALEAYFDGSSANGSWNVDSGTLITLVGCAAEDDVWAGIDVAWNSILHNSERRPAAPYLHMKEAAHNSGEFSKRNGWDRRKIGYLLEDLLLYVHTIDKQRFHQFACTVDIRAWRAYKAAGFDVLDAPIQLCNHYCPTMVLAWYTYVFPGLMKQFHYFFDYDEPFRDEFEAVWKAAKANPLSAHGSDYFWSMITTVTSSDMKDHPALQMADLLAWAVNRSIASSKGKRLTRLGETAKAIFGAKSIVWDEARFAQDFGHLKDRRLVDMKTESPKDNEAENFDAAMNKILSVSHDELKQREAEWKKQRERKKRSKARMRP